MISMMKRKGEIIPVVKEEEQRRQQQQQQQELLPKSSSSSSSSSNSSSKEERKSNLSCMESTKQEDIVTKTKQEDKTSKEEEVENDVSDEMGPRERLKRHRREVAGHVWIPDMWGQESFLNDWIDCSSFDASLIRHNIMVARSSLIQEPHIIASSSLNP